MTIHQVLAFLALVSLVVAAAAAWVDPRLRRVALGGCGAALVALAVALAERGWAYQHWPMANGYEFTMAFVAGILGAQCTAERLRTGEETRAPMLSLGLLLLVFVLWGLPEELRRGGPAVPALHSVWFQVHAGVAVVAYGAFALAGAAALRHWLADEEGLARAMERLNRRAITLGFPWMTLVLLTGAIWGQEAWGNYWSWDPKETWALVVWLIYGLFLHGKAVVGWRGRGLSLLSMVGFLAVLFTLFGVRWLAHWVGLSSLHLY